MEALIKRTAHKLASAQNLDTEREAVVAYGMLAIVQMLSILLLSLIVGFISNTVVECIIVYLTVGLLRKFTGGAHAGTMGMCITVSLVTISIMSITAKIIASFITVGITANVTVIIISLIAYCFMFVLVGIKAPIDSPNKPIKNPEKISRLKTQSQLFLAFCLILSSLCVFLAMRTNLSVWYSLHFALMFALLWQSLTLTSVAEKLTNLINN